jgi:hypothetical protein
MTVMASRSDATPFFERLRPRMTKDSPEIESRF